MQCLVTTASVPYQVLDTLNSMYGSAYDGEFSSFLCVLIGTMDVLLDLHMSCHRSLVANLSQLLCAVKKKEKKKNPWRTKTLFLMKHHCKVLTGPL